MVKIDSFEVEQWMDRYETRPGVLNIAETCASSVSVDDLIGLCSDKTAPGPLTLSKKMGYGAIRGSEQLRQRVANLFNRGPALPLSPDDVIITPGAIAANFLLFYTLVGLGDHVICVHPTYQQLYAVPESLGAEVSLWKLKKENAYVPDVNELEGLVRPNTKMIVINNPNNPTGATTAKPILEAIVSFAKARDIIIFSDEVYSPLFHSLPAGEENPPSILSFGYDRTVATGSMSKAFALAGIRLGWIASRNKSILEAVASVRDYTTISVSQLDDQVARYALSDAVLPSLLKRNLELARTNHALLAAFVRKYPSVCSWTRPMAGTTAFIQFRRRGEIVDDAAFMLDVLDKTKVMFLPGEPCFGAEFKGFVRIGYVSDTEVLKEALKRLSAYVEENLV